MISASTSLSDPRLPLYQRVRDALLEEIRSLSLGDKLPTEPELIGRFGVSRTTVRMALDELARSGLVSRRPGRGTFVSEPPIEQELTRLTGFVEDMKALNFMPYARVITVRAVRAPRHVAHHLGLEPDSRVTLIERVRLAEQQPVSFDVTYLPIEIGERVASDDLAVYPIFELLESKYSIPLGEADYRIEAVNAGRRIAKYLDIRPNDAILRIERTTLAQSGDPIDYEELHYRGDRIRYRLRLKR